MKKNLCRDFLIGLVLSFLVIILPWGYSNSFVQGQVGYFFLFCWFMVALPGLYGLTLIWSPPHVLQYNKADILFCLYIVYLLVSSALKNIKLPEENLIESACLAIIYVMVRGLRRKLFPMLLFSVAIAGAAQAVYGNLQLYGVYRSHHGMFNMTGSFFNPGPYAGYLVSVLPVAFILYFFPFTVGENDKKPAFAEVFLKYLSLAAVVVIILVLPATRSRAAWLGALVAGIYLFYQVYSGNILGPGTVPLQPFRLTGKIKSIFRGPPVVKFIAGITLALIIAGGLWGVYSMKKGSADGRLLIWKVSSGMIKNYPLTGVGYGKFTAHYMDYQAGYFEDNPANPEAMVAGDNNYAFNEFIKILTETGITGFVIVILFLFFILAGHPWGKTGRLDKTILLSTRAGIIATVVFGCFSYPGEILPIRYHFVLLAGIAASFLKPLAVKTTRKQAMGMILRATGVLLVCLAPFFAFRAVKLDGAFKEWKSAYTTYQMGAYEACLEGYEDAFPLLKYNGTFLVNYGKALSMAGTHAEAVKLLEYTKNYLPNTVLYTALGDSYKALGEYNEAEAAYLHAWYMNPGRFYPKYLLATLYDETGQKEKAIAVARELLVKKVKVPSTAIDEIREEMKKIISQHSE